MEEDLNLRLSIIGGGSSSNTEAGDGSEYYYDDVYENIAAPMFVDFTSPDPFAPVEDDHYWFCSRMGCDRKHEEEIDPEAISKNFVLRVMAARSPNIKRNGGKVKCPLSAPAKTSKPIMSRLAVMSSNFQKVVVDVGKEKTGSCTPLVKSKVVAAKYMTTPGNQVVVKKALLFRSPNKADVELQGMKRLEIASQKRRVLGYESKSEKQTTSISAKLLLAGPSRRPLSAQKSESKAKDGLQPQNGKVLEEKKCKSKGNLKQKGAGHESGDNKENEVSRGINHSDHQPGRKAIARQDTLKVNKKVAAPSAPEMKYRKPTVTNPKPFRLRTDERGVHKEANLERKKSLKEVNLVRNTSQKERVLNSANLERRNSSNLAKTNSQKGPVLKGSEQEASKKNPNVEPKLKKETGIKASIGRIIQKPFKALDCKPNSMASSIVEYIKGNGSKKSARSSQTKLPLQQLARPQGQLSVIQETSSKVSKDIEAGKPSKYDATTARRSTNLRSSDAIAARKSTDLRSYDASTGRKSTDVRSYDATEARKSTNLRSYDATVARKSTNARKSTDVMSYDATAARKSTNVRSYDAATGRRSTDVRSYDATRARTSTDKGSYDATKARKSTDLRSSSQVRRPLTITRKPAKPNSQHQ